MKPLETAVFGGGCFWGVEHAFKHIRGVHRVVPGYAGGHMPNPTYEAVKTGNTGHAEVVHITYDPTMVSYDDLLDIFFRIHDPTTPNRQGVDVGPQYRSIILYLDDAQRRSAEEAIRRAEARWGRPVVTELRPFEAFYPAEEHHMDYYERHPEHALSCPAVQRLATIPTRLLHRPFHPSDGAEQ